MPKRSTRSRGTTSAKGARPNASAEDRILKTVIRTRTLEELETLLLTNGFDTAAKRYDSYVDPPTTDFAKVDDRYRRRQTYRRQGQLAYKWHGPPSWFDPPYVILEVVLEKGNEKYMTHAGEELLYVLPGADITYEFFFPGRGTPPWLHGLPKTEFGNVVGRDGKSVRVHPGCLIRINSSVPHRNPTPDSTAKAWIVLRPLSGSPASLLVHPHTQDAPLLKFRKSRDQRKSSAYQMSDIPFIREYSGDQLKMLDRGGYLLLASGVLEKLILHRKRSELSVDGLALQCELNKSYVSRLERLELPNVSVPTLLDIAEPIDADISSLVSSLNWVAMWSKFGLATDDTRAVPVLPPPVERSGSEKFKPRRHYLHPLLLNLRKTASPEVFEPTDNWDDLTSVIVIEGEVLFRFEADGNPKREMFGAGEVFHARHNLRFQAEAHSDSKLLVIRYSGRCFCRPETDPEQSILSSDSSRNRLF